MLSHEHTGDVSMRARLAWWPNLHHTGAASLYSYLMRMQEGSDKVTCRLRLLTQQFIHRRTALLHLRRTQLFVVLSFSQCTCRVGIKETPMQDVHPRIPDGLAGTSA